MALAALNRRVCAPAARAQRAAPFRGKAVVVRASAQPIADAEQKNVDRRAVMSAAAASALAMGVHTPS